jgi:phospholipid/cholesterol/gamma-HCH transport system substrate-binding protein
VKVRRGQSVTLGATMFSSLTSVRLVNLKDNNGANRKGTRTKPFAKCVLQVGDGTSRKVTVDMRVSAEVLERVRTDSVASVQTEGLLGDKFIDMTIGSLSKPGLVDGGWVLSDEGVDLGAVLASTGEIIQNVNGSTESIRALLDGFRKAGGEQTIVAAMRSIQRIADEVRDGDGFLHNIIFDKKAGGEALEIVKNVSASSRDIERSLAKLDGILGDVKKNKSLAHELLYGEQGQLTIDEAQKLIAAARQVTEDVKTKDSLVHALLYDDKTSAIATNVKDASDDAKIAVRDLKDVMASVKAGKGTVGQLLSDSSAYEDLKGLLSDMRRSNAIKMLVRYAIEEDDKAVAPK